ncbi:hypothetical protein BV25DRAFT_1922417 [Artomyces pyxidatus]|uniref:Uncharacterized protein n=1 Tax=Artomyces pyxidatus TaxID=48021 RepID=A0ACB8SFN4_9AGAM|nr:hypothetical protein BV25DRAFT_1922417 [Artomyces pyxidatus]
MQASQTRTVECPGCQGYFSPFGFTLHLRLTRDPRCAAIQAISVRRRNARGPSADQRANEAMANEQATAGSAAGGGAAGHHLDVGGDRVSPPPPQNEQQLEYEDLYADVPPERMQPEPMDVEVGRDRQGQAIPSTPEPHAPDGEQPARDPLAWDEADDRQAEAINIGLDFLDQEPEPGEEPTRDFQGEPEDISPEEQPEQQPEQPEQPEQPNEEGRGLEVPPMEEDEAERLNREDRLGQEARLRDDPKIRHFPTGKAGEPVPAPPLPSAYSMYQAVVDGDQPAGKNDNVYGPFGGSIEWDLVRWAKKQGPTSTAVTDLLQIDSLREKLGVPYKTVDDMNAIIDTKLPKRPQWKTEEIVVHGKTLELHYRDNKAELLGLHDMRSATMSDVGDLGPKPSPESEIEAESPSLDLTLTRDPDQKKF